MKNNSFRVVNNKNILKDVFYLFIAFTIIFVVCIVINSCYRKFKLESEKLLKAVNYCNNVCEELEIVSDEKIDECMILLKDTKKSKLKQPLLKKINIVKEYVLLRDKINTYFVSGVLVSNISLEDINHYSQEIEVFSQEYYDLLLPLIEKMKVQYNKISFFKQTVDNMYESPVKETIRSDLTREDYNKCMDAYNNLMQEDLKNEYKVYLEQAEQFLINKERVEAERRRQEAIQKAWIKLKVPYISQNYNYVYNGCEAASLLMGLKYKGYLPNMDLVTYSMNMPKSNDPNTGFYLDIFGKEPKTEAHWIAPEPLAKYAIASSNNHNIINSTGWDLSRISNEVINNNPVIVYLTYDFKKPYNWSKGVPNNLHVLLLTGYNTITKQYLITDPYTRRSGKYEFIISKETMEYLYNAVGKRSVVIR